jgi:hypothetical protein
MTDKIASSGGLLGNNSESGKQPAKEAITQSSDRTDHEPHLRGVIGRYLIEHVPEFRTLAELKQQVSSR